MDSSSSAASQQGSKHGASPGAVAARSSFVDRPMYLTYRAHQAARAELTKSILGLSLNSTECIVLEAVSEVPGLSGVELAEACRLTKQALALLLDKLEKNGLLDRRRTPGMGRTLRAYLTDEGAHAAREVRRVIDDLQEAVLAPLSADERAHLLHVLRSNAERWEALSP